MTSKTALIVLDMIEDLVGPSRTIPGNPLPDRVEEANLASNINRAISAARTRGDLLVFVNLGFSGGYEDWPETSNIFAPAKPMGVLRQGTPGTNLIAAIDAQPGDLVLRKPRVSPFHNTALESLLRTQGVETVALAGVSTEHVVLAGARDAHDRDLKVTILTDCCASATDELKNCALTVTRYFTEQTTAEEFAF